MAFDLTDEELKATRRMNGADKIKFIKSNDIYLITEKDTNEEVQEKLNKIKRGRK